MKWARRLLRFLFTPAVEVTNVKRMDVLEAQRRLAMLERELDLIRRRR